MDLVRDPIQDREQDLMVAVRGGGKRKDENGDYILVLTLR